MEQKIYSNQQKKIILLITKEIGIISSKHITILGTAFKPNTDDVRESISIELIKKLLNKKAKITIYDPKATENTKNIFGDKIIYSKSLIDALNGSQCAIIMTQWKEFENLNNIIIKKMKKKIIIDCRRILAGSKLNAKYYALGIGK